jgi:hypothetical protein
MLASVVTIERPGQLPFQAHIELLQAFLARRDQIVERIQALLNSQQRPAYYLNDRALLAREFEDCFFASPAVTRGQLALRGQAQAAHWADGFKPRDMPGIPNDMFDPADLVTRAFGLWSQTRWPGRNGRIRFAQTLFNLYVVRWLALLAMRLWDDGPEGASGRLEQVQAVLGQLWKTSPADQPVLVRDARWLVPVAQSPTTDDLAPYFRVAEKVAGSLPEEDRIEIHKAAVVMAGGHLRSQLRHFNMQGAPLGDHALLLNTRRSNALDCAMTIQALVPLLGAYARAIESGDERARRELAGVICQGISPDPELFLNRLDLLGAYSMIEHLFVARDPGGRAELSPMGHRHVALVQEYAARITRLAAPLAEDYPQFRPVPGTYSPYGVMFGFSSNLLEHMTMKAMQPDAETRFTLEDVFADAQPSAEKLAWVSGWRRLPHISPQVLKLYEYPQQFAEEIHDRIGQALRDGAAGKGASAASTGRLIVMTAHGSAGNAAVVPELPAQYILSSDPQLVAAGKASSCDPARLLADRNEGEFVVSYETTGGWAAISKDIFTDVLGAGVDARLVGLPVAAADVVRLLNPGLVAES